MLEGVMIQEANEMTQEIFSAFQSLVRDLSETAPLPSYQHLEKIISSPTTFLFLAHEVATRDIIGSLTLVLFQIPTGTRALIEDVVVKKSCRKRGIGTLLCNAAIKKAVENGSRTIDLTSRPSREDANRLYLRLGFEIRNSNVYRYQP